MRRFLSFSFNDFNQVVVGSIALAVTVVAIVLAFAVGTLGLLSDTYTVSVVFEESAGLRNGDPVRVAGIDVGKLTGITPDFETGVVIATFEIERGVDLGPETTVEVSLSTLLGGRYLRLDGPVETPFLADLPVAERRIPIERTRLPLGVLDALGQLTRTVERIDVGEVDRLLAEAANLAADNAENFDPLLNDVVGLTQVLNARRSQIDQLLTDTTQVTDALADKDDTVLRLIDASNELLAEVAARRNAVRVLLGSGSEAVRSLDDLVRRNEAELAEVLAAVDETGDILAGRLPELNASLAHATPTLEEFANLGNTGQWFDVILSGVSAVQLNELVQAQFP